MRISPAPEIYPLKRKKMADERAEARMFVIEGMKKVRKVIEENRRRKLTKHKKIANNTIIEIEKYEGKKEEAVR